MKHITKQRRCGGDRKLRAEREGGAPGTRVEASRSMKSLGTLPAHQILRRDELASFVGVQPDTLREMVSRGELPPPIRLGRPDIWLAGRVSAWLWRRAKEAEEEACRERRPYDDEDCDDEDCDDEDCDGEDCDDDDDEGDDGE